MNIQGVLLEMRDWEWGLSPRVRAWADAIEAAMTQPVAEVIQGWITPIGPWRLSEGAFVYAFPPDAQAELLSLTEQLAEREAEIERLKNWQPVTTAPDDTYVLVLWGSNAVGPEGIEIAERRNDGYWITYGGERIDADGYRVLGWIPLPEKTTVLAGKEGSNG